MEPRNGGHYERRVGLRSCGILLEPHRGVHLRRLFVGHSTPLPEVPVLQDAVQPVRPGGPNERFACARQAFLLFLAATQHGEIAHLRYQQEPVHRHDMQF